MSTIKLNTDCICLRHLASNGWSIQENNARLAANGSAHTIVAIYSAIILMIQLPGVNCSFIFFGTLRWREILSSSAPGSLLMMQALVIKMPDVAEVKRHFYEIAASSSPRKCHIYVLRGLRFIKQSVFL